jgi:selenium metabolism protein YedF
MRIIDTKGQLCPAPLILTKRALKETKTGDSFRVETDSKVSLGNISRFLDDNHVDFSVIESEGIWTLTVVRGESDFSKSKPEDYCNPEVPHFTRGNFVIAFTSDRMGDGDADLGKLLMVNFVKAVKDLDALPSTMVFYNRGVMLGAEGSPVYDHLKDLESMGVKMMFCSTCTQHYNLAEKIRVGTFSNIFEITQIMASAGNVIKP